MDLFEKTRGLKLIGMLRKAGLYPFFRVIQDSSGRHVTHKNEDLIMMGSNNYLGLTHDKRVIQAAKDAIDEWGTGCTGSRFLNGNLSLHKTLEKELAEFFGHEKAIVFATGFLANQGAILSLVDQDDYIFSDDENHASIIEGCRLAAGKTIVYKHLDMKSLEEKLQSVPADAGKLIITDGVFSMNGHLAPLPEIIELGKRYSARVYVDDAHGVGIIGDGGRGTCSHFNVKADVLMGTFSKSFASQGGFICGPARVIDWIEQKARTYMFSAALSPANTATALKALEILKAEPELSTRAQDNARYLKEGLEKLGLDTMNSQTCIIPVMIGDDKKALKLCAMLTEEGVFSTPVVYPAVAKGKAIIRCSVMSTHTQDDLDAVIKAFDKFKDFILSGDNNEVALHDYLMKEDVSEDDLR